MEQQDADKTDGIITVKVSQTAALVKEPPKRFLEIDKTLIIIFGDIFEHPAPETMCSTWLYDEMARTDKLICGSQNCR